MPYTPTTWTANVTPVTAVNMNKIEAGIASLSAPAPSTTPPASPADGDIWYLPLSTGGLWQLRYNASGGTYKWEFVGGAPLQISPPAYTIPSVGAPVTDTAPAATLTIPRAGEFQITSFANVATGALGHYMGLSVDFNTTRVGAYVNAGNEAAVILVWMLTCTAGQAIQNAFYSGANAGQFARRSLSAIPIRVS